MSAVRRARVTLSPKSLFKNRLAIAPKSRSWISEFYDCISFPEKRQEFVGSPKPRHRERRGGGVAHAPREIAEEALAHAVGNATERAYRRGDALEQRRALMAAWESYVSSTPPRIPVGLDTPRSPRLWLKRGGVDGVDPACA
jgi:hypothetical protein